FARDFRAQAGLAERSPEERAKRTMNLYDQVGRLVPAAVTAEAAHSITLTVHAEKVDMWLSCAFELEEQEPHGLTQVKIMPASAPSMSANREELDWDALEWQSLAD
ncbi:MAG: hypothetical protein GWN29_00240, partial [Gammaproteobacteria bacterium]|nr:hypothetical protein [Gammaproteobacteria bacterium]